MNTSQRAGHPRAISIASIRSHERENFRAKRLPPAWARASTPRSVSGEFCASSAWSVTADADAAGPLARSRANSAARFPPAQLPSSHAFRFASGLAERNGRKLGGYELNFPVLK